MPSVTALDPLVGSLLGPPSSADGLTHHPLILAGENLPLDLPIASVILLGKSPLV